MILGRINRMALLKETAHRAGELPAIRIQDRGVVQSIVAGRGGVLPALAKVLSARW